jgi:hypothetical protein
MVIFRDSLPSVAFSTTTSHDKNPFIGGDSTLFTDDHILSLGCLNLFQSDQHLRILQIDDVDRKRILIHLHLIKTQSFFINGRLDLSIENITIISIMRKNYATCNKLSVSIHLKKV